MQDNDLFDDDLAKYVDRSTLQPWGECPLKAWHYYYNTFQNQSVATIAGSICHFGLSRAVREWVYSNGVKRHADLVGEIDAILDDPPPEWRQLEAIRRARESLKFSKNTFAKWIRDRLPSPVNTIVKYDGGTGEMSGQMGVEDPDTGFTLTAELDLLITGRSQLEMEICDYKTGYEEWTSTKVADEWQFRFQPWLVFKNYEHVEQVHVRVWNTRYNTWTAPVTLTRNDMPELTAEVATCVQNLIDNVNKPVEGVTPIPSREHCLYCQAAVVCPNAGADAKLLAESPARFIDELFKAKTTYDKMLVMAKDYVRKVIPTVGEIKGEQSGVTFGIKQPKPRQPTMEFRD